MVNLAAMKKSKDAKGHHRGSACHCASEAVYLKAQKHHQQSMAAAVAPGATVTFEGMPQTTAPPVSRAPISRGETFDSTTSSVGCRSDFNELHVSRNVLTPIPPLSSATQSPIPSAPTSPPPPAEAMFRLNIGGKSYRIREEVVLSCRTPSLLSALINATHEQRLIVVDGYNPLTGEYYMERNVRVADHVLDYFVTGLLHKPNDVCNERFREELDFWKLRHDQIAPCCSVLNEFPKLKVQEETEREFDGVICADFRYAIWQMTEDPSSSLFSKIFSFVSIGFIFASVCGLILGSMPEFQSDSSMAHHYHLMYNHRLSKMSANNSTMTTKYVPDKTASKTNASEPAFVYKPTDMPMDALVILEYICIAWFSFEYLARFLVAPRKSKFVISTMNLIDLFTIIPFFVELALDSWGLSANRVEIASSDGTTSISRRTQSWIGAMLVIRVLRVLRMARVFKLARYSQGLQIFGNTLRSSMTELSMLSMFLVTGTVFFSTVMYFLEKDEPNTDFYSIPAACWWCITTVTTVGYGDTFPITTAGKSVATAASICGIIILAFPISMIVEKFATAQQQALVEDQMKQAQMSAVANDYLLKRFPTRRKACKEPMLSPNK